MGLKIGIIGFGGMAHWHASNAGKLEGVDKVSAIKVRRRSDNSKGIVISVEVVLYYGVKLFVVTRQLQAKIKEKVEYMTAMQVKNVNVSIRSLAVKHR